MVAFTGTLHDDDGNAIPGATVLVDPDGTRWSGLTDGDGAFIVNVDPGSYPVHFEGGGGPMPRIWTAWTAPIDFSADVDAALVLPTSTVNVVVQSADADAIADADVMISVGGGSPDFDLAPGFPVTWVSAESNATSGADGSVPVLTVRSGSDTFISATPAASSPYNSNVAGYAGIHGDVTKTIVLTRRPALSGTLHDDDGNAIPDATVLVDPAGSGWSTVTDADGAFTVYVNPGSWAVHLEGAAGGAMPSFWYVDTPAWDLSADVSADLVIPVSTLTVQVQSPDADPIAGATVLAFASGLASFDLAPGFPAFAIAAENTAATGADGSAALRLIDSPVGLTIQVTPLSPYTPITVNRPAVTADVTEVVEVTRTSVLAGTLHDDDGNAVVGAMVIVDPEGARLTAITDAAGAFSVGVPPGDFAVHLEGGGGSMPGFWTVDVAPLTFDADIIADLVIPTSTLTVQVQTTDGVAVVDVTVLAYNPGASGFDLAPGIPALAAATETSGLTAPDGTVSLTMVNTTAPLFIRATPPAGSPLAQVNVERAAIAGDVTETVVVTGAPLPPDPPPPDPPPPDPPPPDPPIGVDISTGGIRDRLIRDAAYLLVENALTVLGWFEDSDSHGPITMTPEAGIPGQSIAINTLAVTREDMPSDLIEMGSGLSEDRHVFYVDFYAESDALGGDVAGDVRDILRGKYPAVGREQPILPVFDRTQDPVPADPAFYCQIEDVVLDRARDTTREWEKHWFMVRFEVVDER